METIGRYEILGELGRGGCGIVYRALDPSIGRTVAIKTIRADSEAADLRERFRREARSAGILSHPNIVTIHEFNDSGDVMFIAMEYIDGQSLSQRMREGLMPVEFTLATVRAAADALDFAHSHNIVHRDVKPANFLISKQGHVKMADFGIAKMLDADVGLTNTGMVIGTAQYMSPEQIAAKEVTGRSDQFSLAVIAYEMLTGQRPFQGNSWASMMHAIITTEPPPLNQHRKELGDGVTGVLRKALAKDPEDRYDSCKAFSNALEHSVLGTTAERTAFLDSARRTRLESELAETLALPSEPAAKLATGPHTAMTNTVGGTTPTTTREVPPPAGTEAAALPFRRSSWAVPVVTGAVVLIGMGAWFGLRDKPRQEQAAQSQTASTTGAPQDAVASAPASATPSAPPPAAQPQPLRNPPSGAKEAQPGAGSQSRQTSEYQNRASNAVPAPAVSRTPAPVATGSFSAPPPPAATPVPTPAPSASSTTAANPPPAAPPAQPAVAPKTVEPPQAPVATAPAPAATPAPVAAPAPQPAPVVAAATPAANPAPAPARKVDPAEAAAQRRASELQASRKMIADAVNRYRQAFEDRDLEGLKAVWPRLGRSEQNSFQNFFRMARTVKLQLTPVGEPEITATGATARYRRLMNAADERRALPAQDQTVTITFRRSGEQMLIDAIEAER